MVSHSYFDLNIGDKVNTRLTAVEGAIVRDFMQGAKGALVDLVNRLLDKPYLLL